MARVATVHSALEFRLKSSRDCEDFIADCFRLCNRICQGDIGDFRSAQHDQASEFALMDEIDCRRAIAGREHAVVGGGRPAALRVAKIDGSRLKAGAGLDALAYDLPQAWQTSVTELNHFGSV